MTIERNRIYNLDCLDGIREMLRGGGISRLRNNRSALPYQLSNAPSARQKS